MKPPLKPPRPFEREQLAVLLQQLVVRAVGELRLLAAREVSAEAWPRQRAGRLAMFRPGEEVAYVRQVGRGSKKERETWREMDGG